MIVPEVGSPAVARTSGLAGALFTPVQQRVLGLLFGQPDRRFRSSELITLAASGTGAVHRQLQRLAKVGLVEVTRDGNQKYYQADRSAPIFDELHGLALKTFGLVEPLRAALGPLADQIAAAAVYGSVAKGTDHAGSDIDLLVLSDELAYADVYEALQGAEAVLGRAVNPTVLSRAEWCRKRSRRDSFADRIASEPMLLILGEDNALA